MIGTESAGVQRVEMHDDEFTSRETDRIARMITIIIDEL